MDSRLENTDPLVEVVGLVSPLEGEKAPMLEDVMPLKGVGP